MKFENLLIDVSGEQSKARNHALLFGGLPGAGGRKTPQQARNAILMAMHRPGLAVHAELPEQVVRPFK